MTSQGAQGRLWLSPKLNHNVPSPGSTSQPKAILLLGQFQALFWRYSLHTVLIIFLFEPSLYFIQVFIFCPSHSTFLGNEPCFYILNVSPFDWSNENAFVILTTKRPLFRGKNTEALLIGGMITLITFDWLLSISQSSVFHSALR